MLIQHGMYLGQVYLVAHQYDAAKEAFEKALGLNPKSAEAILGLGLTYCYLGNKSSAKEQYSKLKPLNADAAKALLGMIKQL